MEKLTFTTDESEFLINGQKLPRLFQKALSKSPFTTLLKALSHLMDDPKFMERLSKLQLAPTFTWHEKTFINELADLCRKPKSTKDFYQLLEQFENEIFGPPGTRKFFEALTTLKEDKKISWKSITVEKKSIGKYLVKKGKVEILVDFEEELKNSQDPQAKSWELLKDLVYTIHNGWFASYEYLREVWINGAPLPEKKTLSILKKKKLICPPYFGDHHFKKQLLIHRLMQQSVTLERVLANGLKITVHRNKNKLTIKTPIGIVLILNLQQLPNYSCREAITLLAEIILTENKTIYQSYSFRSKLHEFIKNHVAEIYIDGKIYAGDRRIICSSIIEKVSPQIKALVQSSPLKPQKMGARKQNA